MQTLPKVTIELIPDPEEGGFTARIPDIPALGEGDTEQDAIEDLKVGLQLYIEKYGVEAALARINAPSHLRQVSFEELVAHG